MFQKARHNRRMRQLRQRLKPHTTAFTLFLQCVGALALGLVMLLSDTIFIARTTQLIRVYFIFMGAFSFLRIFSSDGSGLRNRLWRVLLFVLTCGVLVFLWHNIQGMFVVIPVALSLWLMVLSISSFISFLQYREEKNTASFQYFLAGVANIGFAMLFIIRADDPVSSSIHVLGVYCIFFGASLFFDFLSKAIPSKYLNRLKHGVRLAPPLVLTLMVPQSLLNGINEFFQENEADVLDLKAENQPAPSLKEKINVEVFVHVSKRLSGTAGHVDLAIEDTIYCYGAYDKQQSKKYGGVAGAGVLYEVHDREKYLQFCKTGHDETIFGFGLVLSAKELSKMQAQVTDLKARAYPWFCPAQQAAAKGERTDAFEDFPSKLSLALPVQFYKFQQGTYKHYWMLGTNCVTFADDLLKASGMKTVLTGIITPGTYYEFLNAEFLKGSNVVVKREVYTKAVE